MRKKIFLLFLFSIIIFVPKVNAEELSATSSTACVYGNGFSVINRNGSITGSFVAPNGVSATCSVNYNYSKKNDCPPFMNVFASCPMGTCGCTVSFSETQGNNSRKLTEKTEGCSYKAQSGMVITMTKSGSSWKITSSGNETLSINDNVKNATSCPSKIYVIESGYGAGKTYTISLTNATDPDNKGGISEGNNSSSNEEQNKDSQKGQEVDPIPVTDIDVKELCTKDNLKVPLKYIGGVLTAVKIIIPILIIIFGAVDFFKVMTSNKSDEIPKALRALIMRVIAGIVIFFIPALIHFLFTLIDDWSDYESNYSECTKCLYDPKSC